jgi:hypothetical protein
MGRVIVEVADVSHKWLDSTKTTTTLSLIDAFDMKRVIAYIHSDDSVEEVLAKKEAYEDILIKTIKASMEWES